MRDYGSKESGTELTQLSFQAESMNSWFFLSFFLSPAQLDFEMAGPEETKNQRGKCPPPDSDPFINIY
jgi:hypothetical protein